MTERIIDFLDALVATVGAVDKRYCLVEKRADVNGTNIPYKYKGNGNYAVVNVDGGSVSYWRIVNSISFDVVDGNKAVKNLQATYPIRYVAMVRRDDINPLTFSQDVANVLEGRNKDLQTQLQAKNVNITVGSIDTDTVKIWGEEFSMPLNEPNYTRSMVMIDLTVAVIAARSCWESCDDFPDILQGFDWCAPSTYQRLTPAQIACLEGFLCGTCADATVQLNGTTVGTIASGDTESFTVNLDGSPSGSWDGTAWQVTSPPCDDATIELNGVEMTTIPSGDTENITVLQSSGATQVGSKQGTHWRIDDSAISINGSPVADVMAEDSLDIDVTQGGSPVGSWNGSAWIVPPCPPVPTVTLTVSDTTPDQTDTVTLTGTSGYTDYYFFYDNGTEAVKIAEFNDGTNTYDWTIGIYGNVDVYVIADGEVSDIVPVSITQTYDSDASAYLTFNSYANDSTVYNTTYGITGAMLWTWLSDYFRAIKAETGLYAKLKVGYLFFGSSAAKAKINLFDPQDTDAAFRATINGGWSFGHFGAITNGTNTYMNTHFNPFVQLAANDGGYGIYKLTHSSGTVTGAEFGCTDSTNFEQLISKATIDRSFYGIGSLKQKDGVQISRIRGFIVMNRENDANSVKFFDRSCLELDEDTTSFTAHPNFNMYIGARNNAGSPLLYLESGQALGMWYAFDGLTDSQRIALRVATDTLMNNIGW